MCSKYFILNVVLFATATTTRGKFINSLESLTSVGTEFVKEDGKSVHWIAEDNDKDIWYTINKLTELNVNISLVGWQYIYNSDGNIAEIVAIEVAIPIKDNPEKSFLDSENEKIYLDRSFQHELYKKFGPYDILNKNGIRSDIFLNISRIDRSESQFFLYWNPNVTYVLPDEIATYHKTQVATKEEINKFVATIFEKKDQYKLEPVIVKFDKNHKFQEDLKYPLTSPSIVTYVLDAWQASEEVLLQSPLHLTQIFFKYENKVIPKQLASCFNEKYQEYEWRVLVNPKKFYLDVDVWIKLSIDGFEFFDDDQDVYLVHGVLK